MSATGGLTPEAVARACALAGVAAADQSEAGDALQAALTELAFRLEGAYAAAFVLEHGRLWTVASVRYTVVSDGIGPGEGVVGRALHSGATQLVRDVAADPDYLHVAPDVVSEIAAPLVDAGELVGVLNVETTAPLPAGTAQAFERLASQLAPVVGERGRARRLDLSSLARLFVHVGSLRNVAEIGSVVASTLPRVLPVEAARVALLRENGYLDPIATWSAGADAPTPLSLEVLAGLRKVLDPGAVLQRFEPGAGAAAGLQLEGVRTVVLLPLRASGVELGLLAGASRFGGELTREQVDLAALLGAHAAVSLDATHALDRERRTAATDPLTGLLNRRGFEAELDRALAKAQDERRPSTLLVVDCDDFKDVNDRAGHSFGDAVLAELGTVLAASVPAGAVPARVGGDEFVVLLPGVAADDAVPVAGALVAEVRKRLADAAVPLRLSGGVATYPFDGATGSQLVRAADQALYDAKANGKNHVVGFRDLVRLGSTGSAQAPEPGDGRRPRPPAVADAAEAALAVWREQAPDAVLERLAKTVTFVVGATATLVSRLDGTALRDVVSHALRDVDLGPASVYLVDDFPLTREVLETGRLRAISFLDDDLDPAEAFVLRDLGMSSCLLLPVAVGGAVWGLVEVYDMRMRRYTSDDQALASFLVGVAAARLETLGEVEQRRRRLPVRRPPKH